MKKIRNTVILILLTLRASSFIFAEGETVTESFCLEKIKVCIDKAVYCCTDSGIENLTEEESFIRPETVLSFCSLKCGKSYTARELEKQSLKTELRLEDSNLFYSVSCGIMHSRKSKESVTFIIEVRQGFLNRFGGGNIYAFFGREALFGKRQFVGLYAGYNHNGAEYTLSNAFNRGIILSAFAFFDGPEDFTQDYIENSAIKFKQEVGSFVNPDLRVCLDTRENLYLSGTEPDVILSPFINYSTSVSRKIFLESEARGYFCPLTESFGTEAFVAIDVDFTGFFSLAFMTAGGIHNDKQDSGFDLYARKNNISSSSAACNSIVRAGYSERDLSAGQYVYSSAEARFPFIKIHPLPLINLTVSPFVYTDIAFLDSFDSEGFRDGFGGGIRLFFDSPVFTWFTFSYGANDSGEGRFVFTASKGY